MDLSELKIKATRSQLDYLKVELEYKSKVLETEDNEFGKMLNEFLEANPKIKEVYDGKEEKRKNDIIDAIKTNVEKMNNESETETETTSDIEKEITEKVEKEEKPKKLKELYRKIVKLTHPDRVKDTEKNKLYLEATEYYDNIDLISIYQICDQLNIPYELDPNEIGLMDKQISSIKDQINFVEGTYTWKWYTAPTDKIKQQIIVDFVNMKINTK